MPVRATVGDIAVEASGTVVAMVTAAAIGVMVVIGVTVVAGVVLYIGGAGMLTLCWEDQTAAS